MPSDLVSSALLFLVGLAAGMVNVMAGGGSALTLPVLIFLGLDGSEANGTNRLSILLQNISATASFSGTHRKNFPQSFRYSLLTVPGAVFGALAAVVIDDLWFRRILAAVIIFVAVSIFFPFRGAAGGNAGWRKILIYPGLVAVGFYGGFMQVGIGIVIMALLFHSLGLDVASVNAHKVIIVLVYTLPAMAVFFLYGDVNVLTGLNLAAGTMLGAWWAARLSVRKGASAVRYFLLFAIILSAMKLFDLF